MSATIKYTFYKNYMDKYYLTHCEIDGEEPNTLLSITLPSYIITEDNIAHTYGIYASAFYGNQWAEEIIIPGTVTEIGKAAFARSTIRTIKLQASLPPYITVLTFLGLEPGFVVEVAKGTLQLYEGQKSWDDIRETKGGILKEGDFAVASGAEIPALAYLGDSELKQVFIGEGINKIGQQAYLATSNLTNITSSSNLVTIDDNQNIYYSTDTLVRTESEPNLENKTLWPNSMYRYSSSELTINASNINQLALQNSEDIEKIIIGPNVKEIQSFAFVGCKAEIEVDSNNQIFGTINNCLVKVINNEPKEYELLYVWGDKEGNIDCETLTNDVLTYIKAIPAYCFVGKKFVGYLDIPENIEYIGQSAFKNAYGLLGINIRGNREKLLTIGDQAFYNLNKVGGLESFIPITMSNEKMTIGSHVFGGSLPLFLTIIGETNEVNISIMSSTFESLKDSDEVEYSLKAITFENKEIKQAYENNDVWKKYINNDYIIQDLKGSTYLMIPYGTKRIESNQYENNTDIKKVYIPTSVTSIGHLAFSGCTSLAEVECLYPNTEDNGKNGLTIDNDAFRGCTGLYSFEVPKRIWRIGNDAFHDCFKLIQIICYADGSRDASSPYTSTKFDDLDFTQLQKRFGGLFSWCLNDKCIVRKYDGQEEFLKYYTNTESVYGAKTVYFVIGDDSGISAGDLNKNNADTASSNEGDVNFYSNNDCVVIYQDMDYIENEYCLNFPSKIGEFVKYHLYLYCSANNNFADKILLPPGIETIGSRAFYNCRNISKIFYNTDAVALYHKYGNDNKYRSNKFDYCGRNIPKGIVLTIGKDCHVVTSDMFSTREHGNSGSYPNIRSITAENLKEKSTTKTYLTLTNYAFSYLPKLLEVILPRRQFDEAQGQYSSLLLQNSFSECPNLFQVNVYCGEDKIAETQELFKIGTNKPNGSNIVRNAKNIAYNEIKPLNLINDTTNNCEYYVDDKNTQYLIGFYGNKDKTLVLDTNTNIISNYALYDNQNIETIDWNGVSNLVIKSKAFAQSSVVDFIINASGIISSLENSCFQNCKNLKTVDLANSGLSELKHEMFQNCTALTSIALPENLKQINANLLNGCSSLTHLTIPESVTGAYNNSLRIGNKDNRATITILRKEGLDSLMSIENNVFNKDCLEKIIVPKGYGAAYKAATNWANFAEKIEEATE